MTTASCGPAHKYNWKLGWHKVGNEWHFLKMCVQKFKLEKSLKLLNSEVGQHPICAKLVSLWWSSSILSVYIPCSQICNLCPEIWTPHTPTAHGFPLMRTRNWAFRRVTASSKSNSSRFKVDLKLYSKLSFVWGRNASFHAHVLNVYKSVGADSRTVSTQKMNPGTGFINPKTDFFSLCWSWRGT